MSYYCSDTHCHGKISINLDDDSCYINNEITKCKNIKVIKPHNMPDNKYKYERYNEIKNDIEFADTQIIIRKCKDYNYMFNL